MSECVTKVVNILLSHWDGEQRESTMNDWIQANKELLYTSGMEAKVNRQCETLSILRYVKWDLEVLATIRELQSQMSKLGDDSLSKLDSVVTADTVPDKLHQVISEVLPDDYCTQELIIERDAVRVAIKNVFNHAIGKYTANLSGKEALGYILYLINNTLEKKTQPVARRLWLKDGFRGQSVVAEAFDAIITALSPYFSDITANDAYQIIVTEYLDINEDELSTGAFFDALFNKAASYLFVDDKCPNDIVSTADAITQTVYTKESLEEHDGAHYAAADVQVITSDYNISWLRRALNSDMSRTANAMRFFLRVKDYIGNESAFEVITTLPSYGERSATHDVLLTELFDRVDSDTDRLSL